MMLRLNTVIADEDENYLNRLSKFLMDHHGSQFEVHSFTKRDLLRAYVENNAKTIDVVLCTPDLYFDEIEDLGIQLVCILSDGKLSKEYPKSEIFDKFQLAETIANRVMHLFSEKTDVVIKTQGRKDTKIFGVYSPLSGSGKTSIAYGLCLRMAMAGKKVFYLNFEDNATTELFFDTQGEADLSQVLFYLKTKVKNLSVKIDAIKKEDPNSGIHYFNPLKSHLELEDVTAKEYLTLLKELKSFSLYDAIIVDLSAGLNEKIAEVLNYGERILLPLVKEESLKAKTAGVIKDFDILYQVKRINLYHKLLILQNKWKEEDSMEEIFSMGGVGVTMHIPFEEKMYVKNGDKLTLNLSGAFGKGLDELEKRLK
jgi:cellulose biosynthesis protein BcsQ